MKFVIIMPTKVTHFLKFQNPNLLNVLQCREFIFSDIVHISRKFK